MINGWTLVIQAINFAIVVFILYKLLYKPVRRIMQERQDSIAKQMDDAKNSREEADGLRAQYEQKLADADAEAEKNRAEIAEQAGQQAEQIIQDAREDAKKLRKAAEASIVRERERAAEDLRAQVVTAASAIAGAMGASGHREAMHVQAIERIESLLDELDDETARDAAEDLAGGDPVHVGAAPELSEKHRDRIAAALSKRLGVDDPNLDVTLDESLVAGVEIRIGRLILKAHWREQIARILLEKKQAGIAEEEPDAQRASTE